MIEHFEVTSREPTERNPDEGGCRGFASSVHAFAQLPENPVKGQLHLKASMRG
jgi:hypothetical protein